MARAVRIRKKIGSRSVIVVRPSPSSPNRALVTAAGTVFPAAIGRSGRTIAKREGDGATPRTRMRLEYGFIRGDRIGSVRSLLPLKRITKNMGWCDAPLHPCYNRPVKLPFPASHERLLRDDHLYDVCLVMDWNRRCRQRGLGSAIFFHIARPDFAPTEGCVAVSPAAMRRILAYIGPGSEVIVR